MARRDFGNAFRPKAPLYSDLLRQNSPRVSCEHFKPAGPLGAFFDHLLRIGRRTYVTPLPSRLSLRQICDGIRMNICASFTFCREFVQNSFMNYEEHMCRLSISAKSPFHSRLTFRVFFRRKKSGPDSGPAIWF